MVNIKKKQRSQTLQHNKQEKRGRKDDQAWQQRQVIRMIGLSLQVIDSRFPHETLAQLIKVFLREFLSIEFVCWVDLLSVKMDHEISPKQDQLHLDVDAGTRAIYAPRLNKGFISKISSMLPDSTGI